jgi:hypothetical protein
MTLSIEDIVDFASKVLYTIIKNEISIDKAFQRVKQKWTDRESYKVYYDVVFSVVKNYFKAVTGHEFSEKIKMHPSLFFNALTVANMFRIQGLKDELKAELKKEIGNELNETKRNLGEQLKKMNEVVMKAESVATQASVVAQKALDTAKEALSEVKQVNSKLESYWDSVWKVLSSKPLRPLKVG